MVVPNQKNIKVHFATMENERQAAAAIAAGVQYGLGTAYSLIVKKFKDDKHVTKPNVVNNTAKRFKHYILDSGLFTLMFGAEKGAKDEKYIDRWYECLSDYVLQQEYTGAMVEVDCQKVLGVDKAWELRYKLRDKVPNRIINVFHYEDGQKGLDRLIEFSDYLALSVPELRAMNKKNGLIKLANYVKNKKPSIDIHLLGCTEKLILKQLNFCTTADSSSWLQPVRYGTLPTVNQKRHQSELKQDVINQHYDKYVKVLKQVYPNIAPQQNKRVPAINTFSAEQHKLIYTKYAGSQD